MDKERLPSDRADRLSGMTKIAIRKYTEGRLLTPNDMKDAMRINIKNPLHFEAEQIDFERLRDAQDAKTLKEVGERLFNKSVPEMMDIISGLVRGELR